MVARDVGHAIGKSWEAAWDQLPATTRPDDARGAGAGGETGVPNVECDEYTIGRMAAQHLLGQEHKHFSCFRYSRNIHAMRRMAGFQDALKEAGYDCTDLEILSEHGSRAGEWFRKRLSRLSKPHG